MSEICTLQCGMFVAAPSGFCLLRDACSKGHPGIFMGRGTTVQMIDSWSSSSNHSSSQQQGWPRWQLRPGKPSFKCEKPWPLRGAWAGVKSFEHSLPQADIRARGKEHCSNSRTPQQNYRGESQNWHPFSQQQEKRIYSVNKSQYARLHASQSNLLYVYKSKLSTRNDKASRCGLLSLTLRWCPISCAGELPDTKVQQVYQRWMRMCALLHCGNVDCPALTKGLLNCQAQPPTLSTLHSPRREWVHKTTGLSDVQFTYKPILNWSPLGIPSSSCNVTPSKGLWKKCPPVTVLQWGSTAKHEVAGSNPRYGSCIMIGVECNYGCVPSTSGGWN